MKRLTRFFALMMLRLVVVCSVVLWGVSRMYELGVTANIGKIGAGLIALAEGFSENR